jgi:hypothetical protein
VANDDDQFDRRPVPDPTVLTTEALVRAVGAERDYVDGRIDVLIERLDAIDTATKLLNETVNRVPTDVQREVLHLRELTEEKLASVDKQFLERDTRSERESRDNKVAVDAAFAAQKEAAATQDSNNQKMYDKSEKSTEDKISKLAELFKTTTDSLAAKIDDLKERISETDKKANGLSQQKVGATDTRAFAFAALAAVVGVIGIVVAIAAFLTK